MASRVLVHQLLQVGLPRVVVAVAVAAAAGGPLAAEVRGQETVNICHAAGAGYVQLTLSFEEIEVHVDHEGDIIPAPPEGCPEFVRPDDLPPVTPTPTVTPTPPPADPAPEPDGAAPERGRGPGADAEDRDGEDPAPGTGGQGAGPGAGPSPAAPAPGDAGAQAAPPAGAQGDAVGPAGQEPPGRPAGGRTATGLPVTGSEPGLVALFAAGFLLTGLGLRLLVGPPPVRPAG